MVFSNLLFIFVYLRWIRFRYLDFRMMESIQIILKPFDCIDIKISDKINKMAKI